MGGGGWCRWWRARLRRRPTEPIAAARHGDDDVGADVAEGFAQRRYLDGEVGLLDGAAAGPCRGHQLLLRDDVAARPDQREKQIGGARAERLATLAVHERPAPRQQ